MRILVLEDAKSTRKLLMARLVKEGHSVEGVDNGHQGFLQATSSTFDVIITDINMPHWDGFKFIEAIEVICPHLPLIISSSMNDEQELLSQLSSHKNVIEILPKPLNFTRLFEVLQTIPVYTHYSINKMARIVCTIGPACTSLDILGKMILAGMDVARLNFSHGTYDQHENALHLIREAEVNWDKPIAVLQDLCGPKLRTGLMEGGSVELSNGKSIVVQAKEISGTAECISTIAPQILADLKVGEPILLDDGLMELRVTKGGSERVVCEIVRGGTLKSSKGMNLPATNLSMPSITDKDWQDLDWGLKHSIDYVALSFVRSPDEIVQLKEYIKKNGKRDIRVIAKIEKPEAVKHIKGIIEVADAIMVARGDMGVELPAARVPWIQQEIIRLCWEMNTPVITATQMLDSMTYNSRPTRAEVTDVSVAIKEGTDAVMLSQETAVGTDPVNVVRTMASIICEEERHSAMSVQQYRQMMNDSTTSEVITAAASLNSTKATILLDPQGLLYPTLSKWNRRVVSILVTNSTHVARQASLYKNIIPLIIREDLDEEAMLVKALNIGREIGYLNVGDTVAVVYGENDIVSDVDQIGALRLVVVNKGPAS